MQQGLVRYTAIITILSNAGNIVHRTKGTRHELDHYITWCVNNNGTAKRDEVDCMMRQLRDKLNKLDERVSVNISSKVYVKLVKMRDDTHGKVELLRDQVFGRKGNKQLSKEI
jgi:hypothetical protein